MTSTVTVGLLRKHIMMDDAGSLREALASIPPKEAKALADTPGASYRIPAHYVDFAVLEKIRKEIGAKEYPIDIPPEVAAKYNITTVLSGMPSLMSLAGSRPEIVSVLKEFGARSLIEQNNDAYKEYILVMAKYVRTEKVRGGYKLTGNKEVIDGLKYALDTFRTGNDAFGTSIVREGNRIYVKNTPKELSRVLDNLVTVTNQPAYNR